MTTFPINANTSTGFNRSESLLSVDDLKNRYLFGIPLTDASGKEMPDDTLKHAIDSAISFIEHKFDIIIQLTQFEERYDYNAQDYMNFSFLQLKHRPGNEVIEMKAMFPQHTDLVKYPKEWYVLEKESAQIQLSPVEGTFSGLVITRGGSYLPLIYGTRSYWPHFFQITYTAGFCPDQIPVIINEMVGLQAAISILEIMGDILHGPGLSSESVGLDGASVSKGLNAPVFAARIESYRKKLDEYGKAVTSQYNKFPSIVV